MKLRGLIPASAIVAFCFCVPADAATNNSPGGKEMRKTGTSDFMRHPSNAKYYTESWTTILHSTRGHVIYVNFALTNIGIIHGSAGLNMSITQPGKKAEHWAVEHSLDDYSQNKGIRTISIAGNSMTLKGRKLAVRIDEKDMKLNVKMTNWYPAGYKFHDGKTWVDSKKKKYFAHFFHVPRGKFTAEMTYKGKTCKLHGSGYMDHMTSNRLTSEYTRRWWTVRYFAPDYTLAFISMQMDRKFGGDVVTRAFFGDKNTPLAVTDKMDLKPSQFAKDNKAGHKYHSRFDVGMNRDNFEFKATFQSRQLHDREAVVEGLPKVQQGIARLFAGNPVVYRMKGVSEMKVKEGDKPEKKLGGTALMETIVLED